MHLSKDEHNNSVIGSHIYINDSKNCIINLNRETEAVIDGLEDYLVIQSDNRLMIIKKSQEQELKNFVKELETKKEG